MKIDLHVHSIFSDGENTPLEILDMCKNTGVKVVSITDHNNIEGVRQAIKLNPYSDIKVIPGLEFSARYNIKGANLHILGYNVDLKNKELNSILKDIMEDSKRRIESLIYQLNKNYNIRFKDSDVEEVFSKQGNIGRPEVAKLCVKYGYASSVQDAFQILLKPVDDKLVKKKVNLTDEECIKYIVNAGGIPSLAHPITLKKEMDSLSEYLKKLKNVGLESVEVYHSIQDANFTENMLRITKELDLLYSLGSDYHGEVVTPDVKIGRGKNNNLSGKNATILSKILKE